MAENGGSIFITVNRLNGNAPVSIDYATSDDTAIAGTDYTAVGGTLDFTLGQTSQTIRVYITNNSIYEGDKTFDLMLSTPQGGVALGQWSSSVVTIQDDEAQPGPSTIAFGVASVDVSESGTSVNLVLTRTGGTNGVETVDFATSDGTAVTGGDYTANTGTVTFTTGVTSRSITLLITNDAITESPESFTVTLSNPLGGTSLGTIQTVTVNILDDDTTPGTNPGVISVETALYTSSENNSTVTYALTRTGGTDGIVSVLVTFEDGSAVFGTDYNASSQSYTATFQDGESRITGTVSIIDDSSVELEESFGVRLSNPQGGATLGTIAVASITIADNDNGEEPGGGGSINPLLLLGLLLAPAIRRRNPYLRYGKI